MPRVSDEHLERRRRQILDAARVCFTRKGFHETSMQDVFAESGLSAGAVYRYFKSKNEIVTALVGETTTSVRAAMAEIVTRDPLPTPPEVVTVITETVVRFSAEDGPVRLAPQAWALALTNPEVGESVRGVLLTMRELWHTYVERMRDIGWLSADADTDAVTKTLLGILPGFILQHLLVGDTDPETFARGIALLLPGYRHPDEAQGTSP
jgi:TetR/AcrR family transcriptional regulator, transcriptional repressor of aconitase